MNLPDPAHILASRKLLTWVSDNLLLPILPIFETFPPTSTSLPHLDISVNHRFKISRRNQRLTRADRFSTRRAIDCVASGRLGHNQLKSCQTSGQAQERGTQAISTKRLGNLPLSQAMLPHKARIEHDHKVKADEDRPYETSASISALILPLESEGLAARGAV